MAESRVCPKCGALNGKSEARCYRCGRRLGGLFSFAQRDARTPSDLATRGLAFACVAVFGLCALVAHQVPLAPELGERLHLGTQFPPWVLLRFGMLFTPLWQDAPWTVLSAVFVHGSVLHLGFNVWTLVRLGTPLEARFGSARALILFLLAGAAGFLATVWWYEFAWRTFPFATREAIPTYGASGGVFGQLGALIGVAIARRDPNWKAAVIDNLIFAVALGLMMQVNNIAHGVGFLVGLALGYAFEHEPRRALLGQLARVLAWAGVLASMGSLVASARSPIWREVRAAQFRESE